MERVRSSRTEKSTYDTLAAAWLAAQPVVNTRSAYRTDLAAFGRWCAQQSAFPLRVTTADVIAFQAACADVGDSASTIRRRSSSLSSFFQFAIDEHVVASNAVLGSQRPRIAVGDPSPTADVSAETIERSLAWAEDTDSRLHALVSLIVFDGLKLGEALAADVDDLSGRSPRVRLTLARRTGQTIVLHERSHGAVRRLAGRRVGQPLFVSERPSAADAEARRLTRFGADHLIKQLPVADGAPRLSANTLRRYHIMAAHRAGIQLEEIGDRAVATALGG